MSQGIAPTTSGQVTEFESRYAAIHSRDERFDGQFITAVKSTGIYCRPSCPARTPKRSNVECFLTSAAAHEAGFRACKRCLPEAAPGSSQWNVRQDVAARAMRLINDGVVDREGVDGLARTLGFSERHLYRIMKKELGVGPLGIARTRRAQLARTLLVSTTLSHVDIAFAAGFGSVRQFNDTMQEIFALTPLEIRAVSVPGSDSLLVDGGRSLIELDLPVRQPFDALGVFDYFESRAIEGLERTTRHSQSLLTYARTLALPSGFGGVEITMSYLKVKGDMQWRVSAKVEVDSLGDLPVAVSRIRRLLDLDADAVAIDQVIGRDESFGHVAQRTPGMRVHGSVDPTEMVIRAIVGQQISVVAARGHLTRLVRAAGAPYVSRFEGLNVVFPAAEAIADHVSLIGPDDALDPARSLRLPRRQSNTVHTVARAMANGELRLHYGMDKQQLISQLKQLPGIGEWTAQYVAMRVLNDSDAWLIGDVALIAGAKRLGVINPDMGLSKQQEHVFLAEYAQRFSPWRSYFAGHLWKAASSEATP